VYVITTVAFNTKEQ